MPDPYKRLEGETVSISPDVLDQRPAIASEIAKIAALWASLEMELTKLFSALLLKNERVAFEMFHELHDPELRQKLFLAASKHLLSHDDRMRLQGIATSIRRIGRSRNIIVHGLWALGDKTNDDAILLCEDRVVSESFSEYLNYVFVEGLAQGLLETAGKDLTPSEAGSEAQKIIEKRVEESIKQQPIDDFQKYTLRHFAEIRERIIASHKEVTAFAVSVLLKSLATALEYQKISRNAERAKVPKI